MILRGPGFLRNLVPMQKNVLFRTHRWYLETQFFSIDTNLAIKSSCLVSGKTKIFYRYCFSPKKKRMSIWQEKNFVWILSAGSKCKFHLVVYLQAFKITIGKRKSPAPTLNSKLPKKAGTFSRAGQTCIMPDSDQKDMYQSQKNMLQSQIRSRSVS